MDRFRPDNVASFHFVACDFDEASAAVRLHYALKEHGGNTHSFQEEIVFPGTALPLDAARRDALARALRILHLTAGASYFKAALPRKIVVETEPLTPGEARFFDTLYLHGLGELAFRNRIDLRGRVRFPAEADERPAPHPCPLPRRTAVPIGGGKDSIVTLDALRRTDEPVVLISVGDPRPIRDTAEVAAVEHLVIRRRISPALLELNRLGAINGHVPISAILAAIFAVAAITEGFDVAALSNERSADEPNLVVDGMAVNHQYSKSSAFERDFGELLAGEFPEFRYFSFLRPLSELRIASLFCLAPEAYRPIFRSCNRAFKLDPAQRFERWCCDCPKCRFVFLVLAPFLPKDELVRIFGKNLFDDPAQEDGFRETLGLSGHKPFECVGTIRECAAALLMLDASWHDHAIVADALRDLTTRLDEDPEALIEEAMRPEGLDDLPKPFHAALRARLQEPLKT